MRPRPAPTNNRGRVARHVAMVLLVGVGYYLGCLLGLQAQFPHGGGISIFWPPSAFLLGVLLLVRVPLWLPIVVVAFVAHLHVVSVFRPGVPLVATLGYGTGSIVQAMIAAVVVRRVMGSPPRLDSLRSMTFYIGLAALFAPAVASVLVAWLFVLTGWIVDFGFTLRQRLLTNVVASLTIPPLMVGAVSGRIFGAHRPSWRRYAEFVGLMLALLIVQVAVVEEVAGSRSSGALLYAPLPLLLWAAVRFGVGGVCLSVLVFAFLSVSEALAGRGPFTTGSAAENAVSLQTFLMGTSIPLILLAALIEERQRSEIALRESQQRYGLATTAAAVGVWDWNLETNAVYVDPSLKTMLGFEGQALGDHLDDWRPRVPPEDFERALSLVRANLTGASDSFEMECRAYHQDGSVRWFLARGALERRAGKPSRLVGTSTDITRRKRAEEQAQLRADEVRALASQLAHLNRVVTMGELAAALAHEINQPLAGVMSNAQAALHLLNRAEPDREELRAALGDIVADDRRASEVIERMRALLRRETPSHSLLDMRSTVEGVIRLVHSDVLRRGISMDIDLGSAPLMARGDRTQLQQVLLNLLLNAFDAVAVAPVAHPRVALTAERAADRVVISVVDNGVGLAEDQLSLLFEPFFTTKPGGIGLGLSICRTIVSSHDGSLGARRNPDGPGMIFSFSLPARDL